jgi:hypothetical protein
MIIIIKMIKRNTKITTREKKSTSVTGSEKYIKEEDRKIKNK